MGRAGEFFVTSQIDFSSVFQTHRLGVLPILAAAQSMPRSGRISTYPGCSDFPSQLSTSSDPKLGVISPSHGRGTWLLPGILVEGD